MTYNIRGGLGMDSKRSIARIAEVIREANVQIVCLQEVHRFLPPSIHIDQAKRLGKYLGMRYVFQKNFSIGLAGLGNAILSSFDIISHSSHSLTSQGEPRGLLECKLQTPKGKLTVFCTHLGLDAQERVAQAGEIAAVVNTANGAKVLCGDMNEVISASAVSKLVASTDLIDALPNEFLTYPSDSPTHRIDFVFCDPLVRVISTQNIKTNASDHLPVIVEIDICSNKSVA